MTTHTHDSVPARVKRLYLLASQRIDDTLKPYGLARSQWQVLSRVGRAGSLSQRDLQADMHVEPATLTRIVDTLAAKGWIERLPNPADGRGRTLRLTTAGLSVLEGVPDPVAAVEARMIARVDPASLAVLKATLETMIGDLEEWRVADRCGRAERTASPGLEERGERAHA
jgi:DNA-binding MarR family transcriptional regulator